VRISQIFEIIRNNQMKLHTFAEMRSESFNIVQSHIFLLKVMQILWAIENIEICARCNSKLINARMARAAHTHHHLASAQPYSHSWGGFL
jgi:hypothetical protein